MKIFILLILTLTSQIALSWECPETNNSYDLDTHWELATDVFWGKVIEGKYTRQKSYDNNIDFKVDIYNTFKGSLSETVDLATSHEVLFRGIEIGGNYIFFLYGNKKLDFCGVLVQVKDHISDLDRLNGYYANDTEGELVVIKYIQRRSQVKP